MDKQPYVINNISMQRKGDQLKISLLNSEQQNYQLFMGDAPNINAIQEQVAKSSSGNFTINLPITELPKYFMVKAEKFQTNIFSERVLPLENAINVRDMGGYQCNDGRYTKWGILFRGDQLSKINENDINILEKYGIKTIVDYRSSHERKIHPNKSLATVLTIFNCDPQSSFSEAAANVVDLHSENVKLVQSLENGEVDSKFINDKGENVVLSYQKLVTSKPAQKAYGQFLHACANPNNVPLFHHCRGGKDRTGFASMLILLLLNVKEEEIVKDYMLTKTIRQERNQLKYNQYRELVDKKEYLDYLMAMIDTREKYIQAAIDKIKELYGSVDQYMIKHFDFTKEEIERMRDFYLEEGVEIND
ncbi:tyrosine-protein phosphatase [Bombilactobacillus bombi]|uniref:tyrosine-protein phosphatase n=1 Tax=Bombilactobacillus bombi TaxID=1303590 RepID=UPI0013C31D20|nr:tyrosine-protein phosphatase [Bombilactobacillus bombi]